MISPKNRKFFNFWCYCRMC